MHERVLRASRLGAASIVALLTGVTAGLAGSSHAAAAPVDLTGPSVIRYAAPTDLVETSRTILQGVRGPSGSCSFQDGAWMSPDSPVTGQRELAYDPATCRSLIATGRPTAAAAVNVNPSGPASTASGTASGGLRPGGSGDPSAYVHTWFHDPSPVPPGGIHVNDVWDEISWNPAYGCADYYGWHGKWMWNLFPDGWYVVSNQSGFSPTCYSVEAASTIHFRNDIFCFSTTNTYYSPTRIDGYANGSWYASWHWSKDGFCSGLLTFADQYGNGNPF